MQTTTDESRAFERLVQSRQFAEFASIIHQTWAIPVAVYDAPGGEIRRLASLESSDSPLCKYLWKLPGIWDRCRECDRRHLPKAIKSRQGLRYTCHAGLVDLIVPVFSNDRHVANLVCGQLLPTPASESGFRTFCSKNRDLKLKKSEARKAYFAAPYLPRKQVQGMLRLLAFFAEHICDVDNRLFEMRQLAGSDPVERAKQFIEDHFDEPLSLPQVAENSHLSTWHFSTRFSKTVGVSVTEYIQQVRIREVKRLLRHTSDPITRLALQCGFNSVCQFNRVFRKLVGCTPRQYRMGEGKP